MPRRAELNATRVRKMMRRGDSGWKKLVPKPVAELLAKAGGYLGQLEKNFEKG